jgi:hypothetical protein
MIGRVMIGQSFRDCCQYVLGKEGAYLLEASGVRTDRLKNTVHDFNVIRSLRPNLKNVVLHVSLSFPTEDSQRLTDEKMRVIANRFSKKMTFGDHQSICVRHTDTDHPHFHMVVNRVGFDGKLIPDSFVRNRAARACDELEIEFDLSVARGRTSERAIHERFKKRAAIHEAIRTELGSILSSGVTNLDAIGQRLQEKNIDMRVRQNRQGQACGVSFYMEGLAVKGSRLDPKFSLKRILQIVAKEVDRSKTKNKSNDYER